AAQADTARLAAELAAERTVTLELQRAILPLHEGPFDLPGLRAVVRYLPASQDSRVGGDWYITAEMPGGHVLLAIGDVGGHGLAGAAVRALLRRGGARNRRLAAGAPRRLAQRPGAPRRPGTYRRGDRRLLRPAHPRADLGTGRAPTAGAGPRSAGDRAASAVGHPARRGP